MRHDAFGSHHPALVFGFFISAIVLTVIVNDPVFVCASVICAAAYYLCVQGGKGWAVLAGMLPLLLFVMAINPVFNTQGNTVLFVWLGDRPYTLEALVNGFGVACMLVAALLWFFSYNKIMTSEKFTYLFGGMAPALTLVFTMVLRLVPTYQRKVTEISAARSCVGRSSGEGTWRQRAQDGLATLSALISWALEGSIISADSMRSRGYGVGKRSSYAHYPFTLRDGVLLLCMAVSFGAAVICIMQGAGSVEFYPAIVYAPVSLVHVGGFAMFTLFLLVPTVVDVKEALSWRISLSKI